MCLQVIFMFKDLSNGVFELNMISRKIEHKRQKIQ